MLSAYFIMVISMATFDEFKTFVRDKTFLKEKVKKGETSWQELFERYDLYGPDDELFQQKKQESAAEPEQKEASAEEHEDAKAEDAKADDSVSSFFNMLSGIDVDKISDGLNGMKKILNILSEVTTGDEIPTFSARRSQKPYKRDDD